jgi:peptidoglycan-N-acetylglucosamine deacetylase
VIATVGLRPRSTWLGTNIRRLPKEAAARGEVAITIDDGPDPEVTPQVLDILRKRGATATFFCIGERAQDHPELCKAIVSAGCAVENHGLRHRKHTSTFGPQGWREEVEHAQIVLEAFTGQRPRFFRPIAGLRNPFLDPLLQRLGLQLVSWTRRGYDTRLANSDRVYRRLTHNLAAGDILLLHDGNAARTANGTPVILELLPRLLDELAARQLKTVTLREACQPDSSY